MSEMSDMTGRVPPRDGDLQGAMSEMCEAGKEVRHGGGKAHHTHNCKKNAAGCHCRNTTAGYVSGLSQGEGRRVAPVGALVGCPRGAIDISRVSPHGLSPGGHQMARLRHGVVIEGSHSPWLTLKWQGS